MANGQPWLEFEVVEVYIGYTQKYGHRQVATFLIL